MDKAEQLKKLKEEIETNKSLPLREGANNLVFGEGNANTKIFFLGEAPGFWEDTKGRPFVGAAGQLLDKLLDSIGLKREEVFISNVVMFRPPNNRDPLPEEIGSFASYVDKLIDIINPKLIVTLGRFSMGKFIPGQKISQIHGKPFQITWHNKKISVVPMYHPAAALRSPDVMRQLKEDFQKIPKVLESIGTDKPSQLSLI